MARAQGAQVNAKEDTRLLALGGALTTDLSQYLTNLTASGAGAYEAPSARSVLTGARTVSLRWRATAAEANTVLLICGNAAQTDMVWAIGTEVAGRFCFYINGIVGVLGSTAAVAAKGPYNLSVGGWWNGAALTGVPVNAVTEARVSSSHHPHVEAWEDWVGARAPAYTGIAPDQPEEPVGPIPSSSGMGDESEFAGRHPWGYCAAHATAVKTRPWSPVVNEVWSDAEAMPTAQQAWWAASAPGDPAYTMDLSWLRWVPVPDEATHVRVRVHVRSWVTAGAAVPLHVRCYVMNRPPQKAKIGAVNAPALATNYGEASITVDDELGDGAWLDLGPVALRRFELGLQGWEGTVHLALAYAIDPEGLSGNDANARFVIDAWQAVPAITGGVFQQVEP